MDFAPTEDPRASQEPARAFAPSRRPPNAGKCVEVFTAKRQGIGANLCPVGKCQFPRAFLDTHAPRDREELVNGKRKVARSANQCA